MNQDGKWVMPKQRPQCWNAKSTVLENGTQGTEEENETER